MAANPGQAAAYVVDTSATAALTPGMPPPNTNIYAKGDGEDAGALALDIAVAEEMVWTKHAITVPLPTALARNPTTTEIHRH